MGTWYFARGKQKHGPYGLAQMQQFAQTGQLQRSDMVMQEGTGRWTPAGEVKELFPSTGFSTPAPRPAVSPKATVATPAAKGRFNPKMLIVVLSGAIMSMCLLCCGGTMFLGVQAGKTARQELVEAERLWAAGNKVEAVAKYKTVIKEYSVLIDKEQRPAIYQRVIDFEAASGNLASARQVIEQAVKDDVSLYLTDPEGQRLLGVVQAEQELAAARKKEKAEEIAQKKEEKNKTTGKKPKQGVTRENYDRITDDMPLAEVQALLGRGKEFASSGSTKVMHWEGGVVWRKVIAISFEDNRVTAKAILD